MDGLVSAHHARLAGARVSGDNPRFDKVDTSQAYLSTVRRF